MRICREINPRTSGIQRAVSNIRVGYIVFPGSAEESAGPPDIERWNERCRELFAELGGNTDALHLWEDIVPPWPTPTPSPEESESAPLEAPPSTEG